MNIIIKGSHLEITNSIQEYLTKRVKNLEKFLDANAKVEADLGKTSNHHKQGDIFRAELNITNRGDQTRVVAEREDLYAAIDAVKDEADEVLSSKKDKKQSLFRRGALQIKKMFRKGELEA